MLCKNCKYFFPNKEFSTHEYQLKHGICKHPKSIVKVDYHTGVYKYNDAQYMRTSPNKCGTTGVYYNDVHDLHKPIETRKDIICTECKYFALNNDWISKENKVEFALCTHNTATIIDYVTGNIEYVSAKDMRYNIHMCSEKGNYFVKNEDELSVKRIQDMVTYIKTSHTNDTDNTKDIFMLINILSLMIILIVMIICKKV